MLRYRALITAALVSLVASSAFAAVTWDAVKKKATGAQDYSTIYKYSGPKGDLKFDYRCVLPGKIRTEILESKPDGSRVGTVLVYDSAWNKDKVRAKTGGGMITRNTTHKDVADTPFYQPIYSLILNQVSGAPTVSADGGKTRFDFKTGTGKYSIWANDAGEILKTERTDGRDKETREFSNIKFNSKPSVDF